MPSDSFPSDRAASNRDNSLKSTGPKTVAGKQKSSLNALRHGLTGQVIVLPTEDVTEYQRFTQSFHDDRKPVGAIETQLVQSLADDAWRLNRAKAIENNLFALGLHEKSAGIATENAEVRDALAIADALREQTKALATLSMHQNRIARTFERTLNQLRAIQAERRAKEREDMLLAGRTYQLHQADIRAACAAGVEPPPPYDPAGDGFVFTIDQIQDHTCRQQLVHAAYSDSFSQRSAA